MTARYAILRFYQDSRPTRVIASGLTLAEAQTHCQRPDTRGHGWFEGYQKEEG